MLVVMGCVVSSDCLFLVEAQPKMKRQLRRLVQILKYAKDCFIKKEVLLVDLYEKAFRYLVNHMPEG